LGLAPGPIGVAKEFKNGVKNRFSEAILEGENDVSGLRKSDPPSPSALAGLPAVALAVAGRHSFSDGG
jgi:hypothetical protein